MPVNEDPHIHQLVICSNVFVRKDGKILMIKRSPLKKYAPGFLAPLGGKVNQHESPFTAAEREVREEAGLQIKNLRLEAVVTEIRPYRGEPYDWLVFHFTADYAGGEIGKTEEGELVLLSEQEIFDSELFPSHREVVASVLNPADGTVFARFEYDEQGEIIQSTKIINECIL